MNLNQAELSQRFYKKQKLHKLAEKILEEWEQTPHARPLTPETKQNLRNICNLPRGWTDDNYADALTRLKALQAELQASPLPISSTVPKLTDLIVAALNMVNAGTTDKVSAIVEALYHAHGFRALELMSEFLNDLIKQEHDRQTVAASLQGYYDPTQLPNTGESTSIPMNKDNFDL